MPQKTKVIFTPFEGRKRAYNSLREAANDLGLSYSSLRSKAARSNNDLIHTDQNGKIERAN